MRTLPDLPAALSGQSPELIVPPPPSDSPNDAVRMDVWGFCDTTFRFNERGNVELTGSRYLLSGQEMPDLHPWIEQTLGVTIDPSDVHTPAYPPPIPATIASAELVAALAAVVGDAHVTTDPEQRLRRGHGHTQAEMYAIKYSRLERVPDVVVLPETEDQIVELMAIARTHAACVVPYGGGTSVSEALRCAEDESRPIVSIDLARMNRILWIDPVNRIACVQAGAVGRILAGQVRQYGFTIGHEPDSIELSTLGGWIATNASGMKKNRYGNIEDLVVDLRAVTPKGVIWSKPGAPRESLGSDPRRWLLGSEGSLGIITQATIKLFPVPEKQRYASILFPDFARGLAFMYGLAQCDAPPASVRLVDNRQLQLNFVLKPKRQGLKQLVSRLETLYVTKIRGYDKAEMVACTLVFEGTAAEVARQESEVSRIARCHGGMQGGSENGERGYMLTYGIAYIRDWVLNHWIIAESFETSAPWDRVVPIVEAVRQRIEDEHASRRLPGRPFITARVTQAYVSGACIYFYYAFYYRGVDRPSDVYHDIECAARDAILSAGGSLSHHHGVGTLRSRFLPRVFSEAALRWRWEAKRALDPDGVLGARTLRPPPRPAAP